MAHLVLSRKYRPQRFADLVGQEAVAQTLSNAITSGRIGHAYLFLGPRGTGKTTVARIFAKALNCERGPTPTPCLECPSCTDVAAGTDLDVVELDAASNNSVEDVRSLRDSVGYRPARSRFRVWIVDEVHMLSTPAFNAFLKTLEEPPAQAKFVFCTTEAHRLPETFTSRCQRLEFRRIDEATIVTRLTMLCGKEGASAEPGVLERIAAGALGGLRDAESLLEQLLACSKGGRVTVADLDAVLGRAPEESMQALLDAIAKEDALAALSAAEGCLAGGAKPEVFLDQVLEEYRAMLFDAAGAAGLSQQTRGRALGLPKVARSIDLLLEKRRHLRDGADGRLVATVAAVELARLPSARDLDALIEALKTSARAPASPAPRPPERRPLTGPSASGASATGAIPRPPVEVAEKPAGATSPGGAATGPVTVATVLERWDEILAAVGGKSRRIHAGLVKARPASVVGDAVVVSLADTDTVARAILRDREAAEAFRAATRQVLGTALRPVVADGVDATASAVVATKAAARAQSHPAGVPAGQSLSAAVSAGQSFSAAVSAGTRRSGEPAGPPASLSTGGEAAAASRATVPGPALAADDLRGDAQVRAVLDEFSARLLSIERAPDAEADERG